MANAEKLNQWQNDAELSYYDDDGPEHNEPVSLDRTKRYLERISNVSDSDDIIRFAIHSNTELIGFCMIAFIDKHNRSCKVGITIGEKQEWGQGLGREALEAMVAYCFSDLGMNRIGAEIFDFNARSLRLFSGQGFRQEGRIRQAIYKRGQFCDEIVMGLLRNEWERSSPRH